MRPFRQILACILTGLGLGAAITLTVHGYADTLRILHALLEYVYGNQTLAP